MKRLTNAWSARVVAVGVACAVAFAGPGVVAAEAVQVAGQQSTSLVGTWPSGSYGAGGGVGI